MTHFESLLKSLVKSKVRFVLVGGLAAVAHGVSTVTNDLDIVYERTRENIGRLVRFLRTIHPVLRGAPTDLPFILDEKTFTIGMNFTFQTDLGDVDLLGEIAGIGMYPEVRKLAEPLDLYGTRLDVLSVEGLIRSKRSAGRPKDMIHLEELLAIQALKAKR